MHRTGFGTVPHVKLLVINSKLSTNSVDVYMLDGYKAPTYNHNWVENCRCIEVFTLRASPECS